MQDDDYYDVQSDEEMLDEPWPGEEEATAISGRDLSLIQRLHSENYTEMSIRRYDSFIYAGVLDNYRAEQVVN